MNFVERHKEYLISDKHFSPSVVAKMDYVTDQIMDYFGDPSWQEGFARKGLIIGDVQSGKTAMYSLLINKSADVGYKMIILLSGLQENLRRQTQERLDEGFIGEDSSFIEKNIRKYIGVGKRGNKCVAEVFTTKDYDFRADSRKALNISIDNVSVPILFVVKKNKNILNNLIGWMQRKCAVNGRIESPLLLIDDETDNASINTSAEDVTAINRSIRSILSIFNHHTYVGFTATPFANIFIDPDSKTDMLKDDLFPKNFIYVLKPPSNYIGAQDIFEKNGKYSHIVKQILPKEKHLPPNKHKKNWEPNDLPDSLIHALNCFLLSCSIRDLRGYDRSHMTMMVNMSRFTDVQDKIANLIQDRLFNIKQSIISYSSLTPEDALRDPLIKSIHESWMREYNENDQKKDNFGWEIIQKRLRSSVKPVIVSSINQRNSAKNIDYSANKEGLRLIAVGGDALSRGLTLEGLSTSYFFRDSQTYDTLMQMGRWFGYREGYADLCRIWMTEKNQDWYGKISEATEELKEQVEQMQISNKTPEEFGLMVRDNEVGLFITAANKRRYAIDKTITKVISGSLIPSAHVYTDQKNVRANLDTIIRTIKAIESSGITMEKNSIGNYAWYGVPKDFIIELLRLYRIPKQDLVFDSDSIIDYIQSDNDQLQLWDVAIQHGEGENYSIMPGRPIKKVQRKFIPIDEEVIQMQNRNITSPSNMREGLTSEQIKELETVFKTDNAGKQISAKAYLRTASRKPLLLIYLLQLNNEQNDEVRASIINNLGELPPVGLALGFPQSKEGTPEKVLKYKVNKIYDRMGEPDTDEVAIDE